MKLLKSEKIRILIIITLLQGLLGLGMYWYAKQESQQTDRRHHQLIESAQLGLLADFSAHALGMGNPSLIHSAFSNFAKSDRVVSMLLIGQDNRVVVGFPKSWVGKAPPNFAEVSDSGATWRTQVLEQGGKRSGVLAVRLQEFPPAGHFFFLGGETLFFYGGMILIVSVLGFFALWSPMRRLERIKQTALRFAQGDHEARTLLSGGDELSALGAAFDEMADKISWELEERSKVENAFRTSEERFARAVSGTNDGIWDWDILSGENYFSPRWLEMLGYAEGELAEQVETFVERVHPEDAERVSEAVKAHLENHAPYDLEMRMRCKDDDYLWIRARGQAEWDASGTPVRMAGSIRDISQQKAAEQALRESETRLHLLTNSVPAMIAYIDADQRYRFNNKTHAVWNNTTPDAVFGKRIDEVLSPAGYAVVKPYVDRALLGEYLEFEGTITYGDGDTREFQSVYVPDVDENGRVRGFSSMVEDITIRKQSERRLLESEDRYARALAASSEGIWDWQIESGENYFSPGYLELLGYDEGELPEQHQSFLNLIHPEDAEVLSAARQGHLEQRLPYDVQYRIRRRDGDFLWIRSRGQAEWDAQGKPLRMTGSINDISRQKKAEDALRESEERFRVVAENTPVPVFISRMEDGEFLFANPTADQLFCGEGRRLVGEKSASFWVDAGERTAMLKQLEDAGRTRGIETRIRAFDGSIHWVLGTSERITFQGQTAIMTGIQDITDRRQAEEEARQAKVQLEEAIESMTEGFMLFDKDERLVMVNSVYKSRVNPNSSKLLVPGMRFEEWVRVVAYSGELPETKDIEEEWILERMKKFRTFEGTQVYQQSGDRWLQIIDRKTPSGGKVGLRIDITERKRVERELRLQSQIIEQIHDSVIASDNEGKITFWNKGAERLLGYTAEEMLGRHTRELYPESQQEFFDKQVIAPVLEKGSNEMEVIMRRKSGEEFHAHNSHSLLKAPDGKVFGRIGYSMDITERKKAEGDLRTHERLMQTVFDTVPHWILVKDRDGKILMANKAMGESFQVDSQHLVGHVSGEIGGIPMETQELWRETDTRVVETGEGVDLDDYVVNLPGGKIRRGNLLKRPLIDDHGNIAGIVGVSQDLTAQMQAEEALRESELRLRAFMDSSTDFITLVDKDFNILDVDIKTLQAQKIESKEALIGRNLFDVSHEMMDQKRVESFKKVLSGEIPLYQEESRIENLGKEMWLSQKVFPVGDGLGLVAADITERKLAELALRENERLLQTIFDTVPDWLFVKDTQLRYRKVNKSMAAFYQREAEEMIGKTFADVSNDPPIQAEIAVESDSAVIREGKPGIVEDYPAAAADGALHYRSIVKLPLLDDHGKSIGFVGTSKDITAQKKADQELKQLNENLEQMVVERTAALESAQEELVRQGKMATLGQLTATVSHELRNPLGTIRTSIFSVQEKIDAKALGIDRALGRIERNVTRCDNIITDLLDFSRNRAPRPSPTDINPWLTELMEEQQVPGWLQLELKFGAEHHQATLDRDYIRRAVINLYENALQAMEGALEEGNGIQPKITLEVAIENDQLKIVVRDTGPGIPQQELERIFEPLYSTKTYGVGLGLPTVRQIMEQNGGKVRIESAPGQGTEATLTLPVISPLDMALEPMLS